MTRQVIQPLAAGLPTGGTTGQVLSKSSGSNYATGWTTPSAGLTLPLSQNLTFSPDSTYDIGAAAASRPRDLFLGRHLRLGANNLAYFDSNQYIDGANAWGMELIAGGNQGLLINPDGTTKFSYKATFADGLVAFGGQPYPIQTQGPIAFTTGTGVLTTDVFLYRDGANVLAQRNATNAQAFRLYNTFTSATDYERGFFRWQNGIFETGTEASGSGQVHAYRLGVAGGGDIILSNNFADRWRVEWQTGDFLPWDDNVESIGNSGKRLKNLYLAGNASIGGTLVAGASTLSGSLLFSPDNTYDIGASGATRPRNLFLAGNATLGGTLTLGGTAGVQANGSDLQSTSALIAGNGYLFIGSQKDVYFQRTGASALLFNANLTVSGTVSFSQGGIVAFLGQYAASNSFSSTTTGSWLTVTGASVVATVRGLANDRVLIDIGLTVTHSVSNASIQCAILLDGSPVYYGSHTTTAATNPCRLTLSCALTVAAGSHTFAIGVVNNVAGTLTVVSSQYTILRVLELRA